MKKYSYILLSVLFIGIILYLKLHHKNVADKLALHLKKDDSIIITPLGVNQLTNKFNGEKYELYLPGHWTANPTKKQCYQSPENSLKILSFPPQEIFDENEKKILSKIDVHSQFDLELLAYTIDDKSLQIMLDQNEDAFVIVSNYIFVACTRPFDSISSLNDKNVHMIVLKSKNMVLYKIFSHDYLLCAECFLQINTDVKSNDDLINQMASYLAASKFDN